MSPLDEAGAPAAAAAPRPIVLALGRAPGAPGRSTSLTLIDGRTLLRRLLDRLDELSELASITLPHPFVLVPADVAAAVATEIGDAATVLTVPEDVAAPTDLTAPGHLTAPEAHRAALRTALAHSREELLLVHEAERALTPVASMHAVLTTLTPDDDAAVPTIDVTDSVKRTTSSGLVNVDRTSLTTLQCPRLIRRSALELALAQPAGTGDEIRALLAAGGRVRHVHGSHDGFAVQDRLSLWQAQISLGVARNTTQPQGLGRRV